MKKILVAAVAMFAFTFSFAQKSPVYKTDEYAINGYDAVAYFTDGKAVKGTKNFLYQWHDAYWLFSSKAHLDSFSRNPEKYAPQFGGYCAYGVSEGHKAPTQPDAWTIVDGKLYLNYNTDVRELWKKNKEQRIIDAEKNWTDLKDKE
ncbi:MAG TPA: YHS domain-containing (seleno)protein [Chitinophagaceae bacterium]|nr:YHS domain-containing (seleno)protein [Chitinophagaceae bacterium]